MKYSLEIGGRSVTVEVNGSSVKVDGVEVEAELGGAAGSSHRHLLVDGAGYDLLVTSGGSPGVWRISFRGRTFSVRVEDERTRALRSQVGGGTSTEREGAVRAPMPGLIVKILVQPGDSVAAGQPVALLEAMKMENEIRSTASGHVAAIQVEAGQTVEKGTLLLLVE